MGADEIDFLDRESHAENPSSDGSVTLSWSGDGNEIVLEQSAEITFASPVVRYEGTDRSSAIGGLPEGTHYFRIRSAEGGEWSDPLAIEVVFLERSRLALLLAMGGIVVAMTIGAIVIGFFRTRERNRERKGGS